MDKGFLEMKKYVILRLLDVISAKEQSLRNIVGICEENASLIHDRIFIKNRVKKNIYCLCAVLKPDVKNQYLLAQTPMGESCSFINKNVFVTAYLNYSITKGIYRWTIQILAFSSNSPYVSSRLMVGTVPSGVLDYFPAGYTFGNGKSSGFLGEEVPGDNYLIVTPKSTQLVGLKIYSESVYGSVPINTMLALEVDATAHTLSFFQNEERMPLAVSHVPTPLHLGVAGCFPAEVVSVRFQRLCRPTGSDLPCTMLESKVLVPAPAALTNAPSPAAVAPTVEERPQFPHPKQLAFHSKHSANTLFQYGSFDKGVYQWTIRDSFPTKTDETGFLGFGAASEKAANSYRSGALGRFSGSCCLLFGIQRTGCDYMDVSLSCFLQGVKDPDDSSWNRKSTDVDISPGSLVTMEANVDARTLTFYKDGLVIPYVISGIPVPTYLGVSGNTLHTCMSLSFYRLPHPTQPRVPCQYWEFSPSIPPDPDVEEEEEEEEDM